MRWVYLPTQDCSRISIGRPATMPFPCCSNTSLNWRWYFGSLAITPLWLHSDGKKHVFRIVCREPNDRSTTTVLLEFRLSHQKTVARAINLTSKDALQTVQFDTQAVTAWSYWTTARMAQTGLYSGGEEGEAASASSQMSSCTHYTFDVSYTFSSYTWATLCLLPQPHFLNATDAYFPRMREPVTASKVRRCSKYS